MTVLSWVGSNAVLALVLALAAWVAQWRLRRPAVAHALWVLALVKLLTPPLVVVPVGRSPGPVDCALGTCGCEHPPAQTVVRDAIPRILFAGWAVGATVTAGLSWHRWARFRRLTAHAAPAPQEWQALAGRLCSELALRRPPEVLAVPGRLPPLVVPGRHRPRVLLPADLLGELSAPQKTALLWHELVHLRRGDHLVRFLEAAVRVVYWWLPGVGAIGRRLRACEEACCDAAVVARLPDARHEYASLLLDVIDFADTPARAAAPHATAMSAAAADLERRLRAILDAAPAQGRPRLGRAVAVGLACVILPCGLHYDLAARPTPATPAPAAPAPAAVGDEPADAPARPPGGDGGRESSRIGCGCPS
jgi:beta-lactamase regulating signal transducer with metallopeptidase domain